MSGSPLSFPFQSLVDSVIIEMDEVNDKLRQREGWFHWVVASQEGMMEDGVSQSEYINPAQEYSSIASLREGLPSSAVPSEASDGVVVSEFDRGQEFTFTLDCFQTSGYESEPSSLHGVSSETGNAGVLSSEGSELVPDMSRSSGLGGESETSLPSGTTEEGGTVKNDDWVAVQRKKKMARGEAKVGGLSDQVSLSLFCVFDYRVPAAECQKGQRTHVTMRN